MRFFTIYDLIMYVGKQNGMTQIEVFQDLKKRGINKKQLMLMKETSYYPDDANLISPLLEYLSMNKLEMDLILGKIPKEYEESYFLKIKDIAKLLEKKEARKPLPTPPFFSTQRGQLYNGDCVKVLKQIDDDSIDLIFADPPFNLNKEYDDEIKDNLNMSEYLNWTYSWIDQCIRVLKPGGFIFIYNIPKWCTFIAGYLNQKLTYWDWVAIDMKYRLPINNRLYPAHYGLVSYIKGYTPNTFNNQRIPLQTCRHCGGDIKDYGGYKSKLNPLGINVSDVWTDIYPVRHKTTKNRKYNELPVKLLDRVISMGSSEGDVILDPFGGSGTTFAVSELLGRKWIGIELGDCSVIQNRINNLEKDRKQLEKINNDKNKLFTDSAVEIRKSNGIWLSEDFQ